MDRARLLSPKGEPHPAPIDDVFAAYRWLLQQGHDPRSIAFSGDSAGGAMVVMVVCMAILPYSARSGVWPPTQL